MEAVELQWKHRLKDLTGGDEETAERERVSFPHCDRELWVVMVTETATSGQLELLEGASGEGFPVQLGEAWDSLEPRWRTSRYLHRRASTPNTSAAPLDDVRQPESSELTCDQLQLHIPYKRNTTMRDEDKLIKGSGKPKYSETLI